MAKNFNNPTAMNFFQNVPSTANANQVNGNVFGDPATDLSSLVQVGSVGGATGDQANGGQSGYGGRNAGNFNDLFAGFTNNDAENLLGHSSGNKFANNVRNNAGFIVVNSTGFNADNNAGFKFANNAQIK
jgi:hypothetical protein